MLQGCGEGVIVAGLVGRESSVVGRESSVRLVVVSGRGQVGRHRVPVGGLVSVILVCHSWCVIVSGDLSMAHGVSGLWHLSGGVA